MPYDFTLSSAVLQNGRTAHYAQLIGSQEQKFTVGFKTQYQGNYGLYNTLDNGVIYDPAAVNNDVGFWAYFIYPTATAESRGFFTCLNTYDRARFTFSFMQYAAHVPNGDFVLFLRKLLALPEAKDYFPKLELQGGRVFYVHENGVQKQLENDTSTQALMDYLNPTLQDIETQELICSARMVHWAKNSKGHRDVQTTVAIDHFKKNMVSYHRRFNLDHAPAKVCLMVCDIRHQGRGSNDRIALALNTGGDYEQAFENLCTIGEANYQTRINTVRATIKRLSDSGVFGKTYQAATNSFI